MPLHDQLCCGYSYGYRVGRSTQWITTNKPCSDMRMPPLDGTWNEYHMYLQALINLRKKEVTSQELGRV